MEQDAYDHHSAIYYLLSERLRQHRTSYPEQNNVTTRIRRASCIGDQVLVRGNNVPGTGMNVHRPLQQPRTSAHSMLQYALNELHLGEVKVPADVAMNSSIPGCVTEYVPPITQPSYTSRMTHIMNTQKSIDTVSEEEISCTTTSSSNTNNSSDSSLSNEPQQRKPRRGRERRSAVDAMMHMNSRRHTLQGVIPEPQETLFVPANHPLLRQESAERPPQGNDFDSKIKIEIVEPTVPICEQTSVSMMTLNPKEASLNMPHLTHLTHICHKPDLGFKDGRRSSDGVNDPFKHLLHKADDNHLKEYEELQRLIQRSITPEGTSTMHQHFGAAGFGVGGGNHLIHTSQMETSTTTSGAVNSLNHEWKSSPLSSQNELMKTLQSMKLQNQDIEVDEMDLAWNGLGPCRRPASYRKISGGVSPIPAHIRKRRTQVIGDCPLGLESEMDDLS